MDILFMAAVVPAAVLLWYVYKIDPVEKEPGSLLARLLLYGALSCIPAIALESLGSTYLMNGQSAYYTIPEIAFENFIVIALSEELCKFVFLRWKTWKHDAFDYVFDGIVYAVFVSLGFAILENIGYVLEYGMGTAVVRAFTAIPGHAIFGVFMGCFYGLAKRAQVAGRHSEKMGYLICAFAVPVFCHGFYDFCASVDVEVFDLVFFGFLILLMFVAMALVRRMAKLAHRIQELPHSNMASIDSAQYNPVVDNSYDQGSFTYAGANQYGSGPDRYGMAAHPHIPATPGEEVSRLSD